MIDELERLPQHLSKETDVKDEKCVRIAGVLAEIQTRHLLNTSLKDC
jgi:hypothetical protein